jgi:uncharacterized membrane protein
MRPHPLTVLMLLAAVAGFAFASVSTSDFVQHLDRQVHGIHCSFLPGIGAAEASNTGCHVTLMSPYSSVMRSSVWGGVPISLPAMSVFAFIAFWALWLMLRDRQSDARATGFGVLATLLPVAASVVMAFISLNELDAACKLCIGIYVSSATAFFAALGLWLSARNTRIAGGGDDVATGVLALSFVVGVLFVAIPVTTYALSAPDFERYAGKCGQLTHAADPQLTLALGPQDRSVPMLEVLDPLCPSCRGFETRFTRMPEAQQVARRALLFPLDNACNWMVSDAIHPGACTLSEAMLCAGDDAETVLAWAFENQPAIVAAAKGNPNAAKAMVDARFPQLARCVGSPAIKARLNAVLRFAVKNRLQVLTPQVFVSGLRLCDEDSDLGLDFALPRLIERARTSPPVLAPAEPMRSLLPQPGELPRAPVARPAVPRPAPAAPSEPGAAQQNQDAPPSEAPEAPAPAPEAPPPAPEGTPPPAAPSEPADPPAAEPSAAEPEEAAP